MYDYAREIVDSLKDERQENYKPTIYELEFEDANTNDYEEVACSLCSGTGLGQWEGSLCPLCKGEGEIILSTSKN